MLNERLKKQIEFIKEIDKLKAIKRQTLLINEVGRKTTRSIAGIWECLLFFWQNIQTKILIYLKR